MAMHRPRRTHYKSRGGCLHCKKRHVKCNEARPACSACVKRQQTCNYEAIGGESGDPSPTLNRNGSEAPSPTTSRDAAASDRLQELRLFHHFSTSTHKSLRENARSEHYLQVLIPKLALSHDFLLDIILALAALHLEHLENTPTKFWLRAALSYQDHALASFNKNLLHITATNCQGIATCAMLMIVLCTAVPSVSNDNDLANPVSEFLVLRTMLEGTHKILFGWKDELGTGELGTWFAPLFGHGPWVGPQLSEEEINKADSEICSKQSELRYSIIKQLEALHSLITSDNPANPEPYHSACELMQECVLPIFPDFGQIVLWNMKVVLQYDSRDPLTRLIWLHYGVALHLVSDRWFAKRSGVRLVGHLLPTFNADERLKWQDAIDWATRSVGIGDLNGHGS